MGRRPKDMKGALGRSRGPMVRKLQGLTGNSVCPGQSPGTLRTSEPGYEIPGVILKAVGSRGVC